jgi:hypothetical protein
MLGHLRGSLQVAIVEMPTGLGAFSGDEKAILRGSDSGSDGGTGIGSVNGGLLYP